MPIDTISPPTSVGPVALVTQIAPKGDGPNVRPITSGHSGNTRPGLDKLEPSVNTQGQSIGTRISIKG